MTGQYLKLRTKCGCERFVLVPHFRDRYKLPLIEPVSRLCNEIERAELIPCCQERLFVFKGKKDSDGYPILEEQ